MRYDGIFLQNLWAAGAVADPLFGGTAGDTGECGGEDRIRKGSGFFTGSGTEGLRNLDKRIYLGLFRVRDGTQVYVEGGSRITVELSKEPRMPFVTSLLLSAGMALICLQRGEPFFHGSALDIGGQAILLCGESGAGKSTVAMELLQRKLGFLADDTVRVHPVAGKMLAEPSYPQQKLCRDMALKCGKPLEELIYIDEERDKYAWRRQDCYRKEAAVLGKIFRLRKDPVDSREEAVWIRRITGKEALETLSTQLYLADITTPCSAFCWAIRQPIF